MIYKWLRRLFKASAFATVMFVMQACYGAPHPIEVPSIDEQENTPSNDSLNIVDVEVMEEML